MLFVIGGLATFVLGGLTGVMVAMAPFDFQAHDTFFVVGHLHTVLIGGTVFPIVAGRLLLLPARHGKKAVGTTRPHRVLADVRRLQCHLPADAPDRAARHGAPRLYLSGGLGFEALNLISSVGAFILAAGILIVRVGRRATEAQATATPSAIRGTRARLSGWPKCRASRGACARIPEIDSRYPLWDQPNFMRDVDEGRFYLPDAEEGRRETLVTTVDRRAAGAVPAARGNTFMPLVRPSFTGGIFIFSTFHWWWLALVSAMLALGDAS